MADEPVLLTREGKAKIAAELAELKRKRSELAEQMVSAGEDRGELTQDAYYMDTMNGRPMLEGRIRELERILAQAKIIGSGARKVTDTVQLGYTVTVVDESGTEARYTIVGSVEADPVMGRISNNSPIGSALIGKHSGDSVRVEVPAGTLRLEIKDIT